MCSVVIMVSMNETKIETDQRYKLLSDGERKFLKIPESELELHYKRPDLAKKQFLLKIKHRAINAIKELADLCDKLPEEEMRKIVTEDGIKDIFKISEKALEIAGENFIHNKELYDFLKSTTKHYFSDDEMRSINGLELMYAKHEKHTIPSKIFRDLMLFQREFYEHVREIDALTKFMEKNGLKEAYLKEKQESEKQGVESH